MTQKIDLDKIDPYILRYVAKHVGRRSDLQSLIVRNPEPEFKDLVTIQQYLDNGGSLADIKPPPKSKLNPGYKNGPPVSASAVKKMLDECFKLTIKLRMLHSSTVDECIIEITNKKSASRAGIKKGKLFIQINMENPICISKKYSPDLVENFRRWVENASKNKRYMRNKRILDWADQDLHVFREYASFFNKPGIGAFATKNPEEIYRALVAHEVAHCVNYNTFDQTFGGRDHNPQFQKVYKILRKKFLGK